MQIIYNNFSIAMLKRRGAQIATYASFLLLFSVWYYFAVMHPVPFWQELGDWSWYSLSQAFTTESIYAGYWSFNHGYVLHPGIPLGISSWVALRISTIGMAIGWKSPANALDWLAVHFTPLDAISSQQRIGFAVDHAELFWLCARGVALLISFIGIYALRRHLKNSLASFVLGLAIFYAVMPEALGASLIQLTNETFALPYVVLYYSIVHRFFESSRPHQAQKSGASLELNFLAIIAGAAAAFGCSIKIYYLAPAIGFSLGLFVAALSGALSWQSLSKYFALGCLGFLCLGAIIILPTMGWDGIVAWTGWNWNMLTHVQEYGTGQQGLASPSLMADTLVNISRHTSLRFPFVLISVVIAFLLAIAANLKSASWRMNNLPFCASITLGLAINLFGLLKHYGPYYALPVCATLPSFLLIIEKQR